MRISRIVTMGVAIVAAASSSLRHVQAQVRLRTQVAGLTTPVAFVPDPFDESVQFVVQQDGRIRVVRAGTLLPRDFLDLSGAIVSGGEQGLLGLAFAPDTATNGRFFVNFTDRSGNTVVARFRRGNDATIADSASRFDLRWGSAGGPAWIAQPYANHNGGNLVFGPDGYLYVGLGDGGAANDPDHRAQDPLELLGKMLRIDIDVPDAHPTGYVIPPGNPFAGGPRFSARPEIWAFGLRNPWRYSFDDPALGGTGALVIGDVGQDRWEEIDYEPPAMGGRNYGWPNREGAHDNVTSRPPAYLPLVDPIHEYQHGVGESITGGYVYRGSELPASFQGRYFFADFVEGRVWSLALAVTPGTGEARASNIVEHTGDLGGTAQIGNVSSFGVDAAGELYVVSYSRGRVFKIVGPPATPTGLRIVR